MLIAAPQDSAQSYVAWIVDHALPFWASKGFDPAGGRFHERLDLTGRALDVPQRAMVQSRQIYVFAHAAQLGWFPAGAALAETALASLLRDYESRDGDVSACIFSIDRNGSPVSTVRDAYTQAFVLLALAWVYRLKGDPKLIATAERIIACLENELTDPVHGGLYDASPIGARTKRQNPLMHLLEAYLALEAAAPGRGFADRAHALVSLLDRRLLRDDLLIEHFAEDWTHHPDSERARIFEPGHHFEWAWLLAEHDRLCGGDTRTRAARLHVIARDHGIAESGLIFDELNADLQVVKPSHRIWPHTEAIKAAVAQSRVGTPGSLELADAMAATLLSRFVDRPFQGGWIDHIDAAGRPLVDYVPASTLYHLFVAASELPIVGWHEERREPVGAAETGAKS